jgi:hypothetical protein
MHARTKTVDEQGLKSRKKSEKKREKNSVLNHGTAFFFKK